MKSWDKLRLLKRAEENKGSLLLFGSKENKGYRGPLAARAAGVMEGGAASLCQGQRPVPQFERAWVSPGGKEGGSLCMRSPAPELPGHGVTLEGISHFCRGHPRDLGV